jgi:hypothetical protein
MLQSHKDGDAIALHTPKKAIAPTVHVSQIYTTQQKGEEGFVCDRLWEQFAERQH